jgi:basic amino acid/polyamine antiporter, APA family
MQNYTEIDPEAGFASAFTNVGLPVIASIISVFAVLSIMTVMLTFLLGVTRVWFSMSRDGLLPPWFAKVDEHGTPQRVTWIAGVGTAFLAGVFPIRQVADLTNIGILRLSLWSVWPSSSFSATRAQIPPGPSGSR